MKNLVVGFTATVKGQAMRIESPVLLTQPIVLEREPAKPGEAGDRLCLPVYFLVIVPMDDLRQGLRWVDSALCEPVNYTMVVAGERVTVTEKPEF
jgi:hypothetical protein